MRTVLLALIASLVDSNYPVNTPASSRTWKRISCFKDPFSVCSDNLQSGRRVGSTYGVDAITGQPVALALDSPTTDLCDI